MDKLISTTEAAKLLGVTVPRVQSFIWEGRLPAFKVGRAYVIKESDLALLANRKTGRPKQKAEEKKPAPKKARKKAGRRAA